MTSLKTMSRAVFWDRAPFVRTVWCLTVANTLSTGLAVREAGPSARPKSRRR